MKLIMERTIDLTNQVNLESHQGSFYGDWRQGLRISRATSVPEGWRQGCGNLKHQASPKTDGGGINTASKSIIFVQTLVIPKKAQTPKSKMWVVTTLPTDRRTRVPTINQTLQQTKDNKEACQETKTQETIGTCPLRSWTTSIQRMNQGVWIGTHIELQKVDLKNSFDVFRKNW